MVFKKCQTAKLTNAGTSHPSMLILSDALKKAGHGAHNRGSLALTKASSWGFAIDGPWRSQMWLFMHLTVNLPSRTCFEPSPYPSARLPTTIPIFLLQFLKGSVSRFFRTSISMRAISYFLENLWSARLVSEQERLVSSWGRPGAASRKGLSAAIGKTRSSEQERVVSMLGKIWSREQERLVSSWGRPGAASRRGLSAAGRTRSSEQKRLVTSWGKPGAASRRGLSAAGEDP